MLDFATEAQEMSAGRQRSDLDKDRQFELALTRLLELIGEAASRVPTGVRSRHPEIAWPLIVGLRNRLVHAYVDIDKDVVWATIQNDVPILVDQLKAIVQSK